MITLMTVSLRMRKVLTLILLVLFVVATGMPTNLIAQSGDQDAPSISNVQVDKVDETTITVTWQTDEAADSAVNYSLQPNYGTVRIPIAERTQHSITLEDLEPGRTYYFRVVSSDEEGNQGISADYQVRADDANEVGSGTDVGPGQNNNPPTVTNDTIIETQTDPQIETQVDVEQIKEDIQQIQSQQQLEEILEQVVQAIQGITEELTIIGPPTVIPETTTAIVRWNTDREATSEVQFSPSETFGGVTYEFSQKSTGAPTTDHEIQLIGLNPFTEYSFKVLSQDTVGSTGESRNFTFLTKASAPDIRNLRVVKVEEDAATLAWDTTVPAKALVEYQDQTTGAQSSVGRPTLSTTHQMRLADLTLGTRYVAFVTAENSGGDRVKSQPIQFITVRDIASPIISNVTNESTLFPGSESRIQTIIEWNTDEEAACLMTYQEGVAGATEAFVIEKEVTSYTSSHVEVVVDFAPATVYQFFLTCEDEAGNSVQSENFVLFTPIQEKNIIDLILENFESTFGWVKNISG